MREPKFTARNFHSAQFAFPLYRVMREYASVLGVWLRSDSYAIQPHTIVLARVIGLDDARNRLQMIGQMLIRADRHEPIAQPHRHRAAILDLPLLPPPYPWHDTATRAASAEMDINESTARRLELQLADAFTPLYREMRE